MSTMQVVAWLVFGGRAFVDRAFTSEAQAVRSAKERNDGALIDQLVSREDALAAIKAALDLGIELTWQKMIMEIAGDTIDDMDSPLSAKVRELSARADAIRGKS